MGSAFLVHSSVMEITTVKMEVMKKTAVKVRIIPHFTVFTEPTIDCFVRNCL